MAYTIRCNDCMIIKRHFFLLLFSVIKFIILLSIGSLFCYIANEMVQESPQLKLILCIVGIVILNYSFLSFAFGLIRYYNNLIIICPEQIIIIKATLILQDKIESLDSLNIVKMDSISKWILSNIFGYGNIIIEQQNDDIRNFHFIHQPYGVIEYLKKQINTIRKGEQSSQIEHANTYDIS